jgi:hypothetical protein
MKKLLLSSALVAALCVPALAQNGNGPPGQNGNSPGQNNNVQGTPGPIAGAGLTSIAVVLGGFGIYWLVSRRRHQV